MPSLLDLAGESVEAFAIISQALPPICPSLAQITMLTVYHGAGGVLPSFFRAIISRIK